MLSLIHISMAIGRTTARNAYGYGEDYSYDLYALIPSGIPDAEGNDFYEQGGHLIEDDVEAAKAIMESKGYSEDNMLTLTYKYNNLATVSYTQLDVYKRQISYWRAPRVRRIRRSSSSMH